MAERDHAVGTSPISAQASNRSPDEIRQDIVATRESISNTVDRLSNRFQQAFDWRTYVADHPWAALGVATCFGFLVAGLIKRRLTPGERITEALAYTVEDMTDRFRHRLDSVGMHGPGMGRIVGGVAMGAITKAATNFLRDRLAEEDWRRSDLEESDDPYSAHR